MHATQTVLAITVPARPVHGLSQPARPLLGAQPHLVKDPHGKPKAKSHTYYARRTTINYTAGVAVRSGSAVVEIPRRGFAGSEKGSRDAEVRVRPVAVALSVGLLLASFDTEPAQAVVGGFEDSSVARGTGLPVALDFTPDHRVLVADKTGRLQVYEADGTRLSTALDLSGEVCANAERGLLGVVVDPSFETNNFVYLYYTHKKFTACPEGQPARRDSPVNRVSRFVMNGNTIDPASEKVLVDNIPSPNGNHNGGDLHFGKDGNLYISAGEGGCDYARPGACGAYNDTGQDRRVLAGKILRITPDGGIPLGNPYRNPRISDRCAADGYASPGNRCQEIFAYGLRNPFRMAFDPDARGTRYFVNDVGQARWEEIDLGRRGANYGWNICEGRHDNPERRGAANCVGAPFTPPLHEYSHSTGCESITGGAFVPNGAGWPDSYNSSYLFGDFVCNRIFKLTPKGGGGFNKTAFAGAPRGGGVIAMDFGPFGSRKALYYTTFANGGEVRRIAFTGR